MLRQTKPPPGTLINWSHPISRGIRGCWLFNEGSGRLQKNCSGIGGIDATNSTGVPWGTGPFGAPCGWFHAGNPYATVPSIPPQKDLTILTWVSTVQAGTGQLINRDQANRVWQFRTEGAFRVVVFNTGGSFYQAVSSTTINDGKWRQLVATWNTGATTLQTWVNGRKDGTPNTSTTGTLQTASADIFFCGASLNGGGGSISYLDHVVIWDRALLPQEIALLYAQPFAFMDQRRAVSYFVPASVTASGSIFRSPIFGGSVIRSVGAR